MHSRERKISLIATCKRDDNRLVQLEHNRPCLHHEYSFSCTSQNSAILRATVFTCVKLLTCGPTWRRLVKNQLGWKSELLRETHQTLYTMDPTSRQRGHLTLTNLQLSKNNWNWKKNCSRIQDGHVTRRYTTQYTPSFYNVRQPYNVPARRAKTEWSLSHSWINLS